MATWTDIDDNDLLPGEPWTTTKAFAVRDNPIAISEGAPDAPKVQAAGTKCNIIGVNEVSVLADFTSVENIAYVWFDVLHIKHNDAGTTGTIVYKYRTSTDGGTTKTSFTTLLTGQAGGSVVSTEKANGYSGGVAMPAGTNYIEIQADAEGASPGTPDVVKLKATIFGEDET